MIYKVFRQECVQSMYSIKTSLKKKQKFGARLDYRETVSEKQKKREKEKLSRWILSEQKPVKQYILKQKFLGQLCVPQWDTQDIMTPGFLQNKNLRMVLRKETGKDTRPKEAFFKQSSGLQFHRWFSTFLNCGRMALQLLLVQKAQFSEYTFF